MTVSSAGRVTRSRWIALRAVAVATLLTLLTLLGPVLLFAVAFWVPVSALGRIFPEEELRLHLIHGVGVSLILWITLLATGMQWRHPERSVAPLWLVATYLAGGVIFAVVSGVFEPLYWVPISVLLGTMLVLHPRRIAPLGHIHRTTALLAALGSIPLMVYAYNQLVLQLRSPFGNPHVTGAHYSTMGMLAVIIVLGTWLGSTEAPGARSAAFMAGMSMGLFAIASLAKPDQASSLTSAWAIAATAWAVAYLTVIGTRRRREWV